jgi:hypothetical protein
MRKKRRPGCNVKSRARVRRKLSISLKGPKKERRSITRRKSIIIIINTTIDMMQMTKISIRTLKRGIMITITKKNYINIRTITKERFG